MLDYQHIGNIKIGGLDMKCQRVLFDKLVLTKPCKDDLAHNYVPEQASDTLTVRLPFIKDMSLNFDCAPATFAKIANYNYLLKENGDEVVGYPIDIKDNGELLPIIKFGKATDFKAKHSAFQWDSKGVLKLFVMQDSNYFDNKMGVYRLVTNSGNSIAAIQEMLQLAQALRDNAQQSFGVSPNFVRYVDFKLHYYKKYKKVGDVFQNVSYVTILPPTPNELLAATKADMSAEPYFETIENLVIKTRNERQESAISIEQALEYFDVTELFVSNGSQVGANNAEIEAKRAVMQAFNNPAPTDGQETIIARKLISEKLKVAPNEKYSPIIARQIVKDVGEQLARELIMRLSAKELMAEMIKPIYTAAKSGNQQAISDYWKLLKGEC